MDIWRFYDITHRDHLVCNPTSSERLDELVGLLELPEAPRVLDIGCGKGELLIRLAETCGPRGAGFRGVGIDRSPYVMAELRACCADRVPDADLELLEMDGADYAAEPDAFDLACCLGASWVFGGHRGTLRALARAVRAGGQVLVGEPFWRRDPDPAYLGATGLEAGQFGTHRANVEAGLAEGLVPLLAYVSTDAEWDRYETLQWRAAARFAADHPDDPDVPELTGRVAAGRHEYLAWGRETLGWALYLFARPADGVAST